MHGRLCALQKEKYKNEDRIKAEPRVKIRGGGGGGVRSCSQMQHYAGETKAETECFVFRIVPIESHKLCVHSNFKKSILCDHPDSLKVVK